MDLKYIEKIKKLEEENLKLRHDIQNIKGNTNIKPGKELNAYSSDRYVSIFDNVPVGIMLYDRDLNIIEVNDTFLKIFEVSKKDISNFNLKQNIDKRILPTYTRVLEGYEGFYEGEYVTNFNKADLYISIHSIPFSFPHNKELVHGGLAVFEDITEHSIAERAVNRSYDTFQRVTDSINAIIYVIDPKNFEILFMNSKATTEFGKKVGKICYKAFFEKKDICKPCQIQIYNDIEIEDNSLIKEFYEEKSGKWYQISFGFIEWIDGRKVALLTLIDISEVKDAQNRIKDQNRKFEETLKKITEKNDQIKKQSNELKVSGAIKDTMFSIIAHDLRGPVGNITSALDIIIDDIDDFTKQEIIEIIRPVRDSAGSAYNLLVNLLFWAKNESGETFFIREEILLNDILEDVLTLFKPNFESKNLKLINNLKNDFYVFADEHMIHTIIRNLISNAVKYTNQNGEVEISINTVIEKDKEYVKFSVRDDGVGISKENISKMLNTKEFYSTYGTNKEKGTGIGIILTKEFVERHNGFIKIESEAGIGTEISVFLPAENS